MRTVLVLLAGILLSAAASAEEFGRLFFTPAQRAALDARREAGVPDKPAPPPVAGPGVTRLDGYVRRSNGRGTIWVNGQPLEAPQAQSSARIPVPVEGSAERVPLKPGEALDRGTGKVIDAIGPDGKIRVRPAR